jgi:hypothetical protein
MISNAKLPSLRDKLDAIKAEAAQVGKESVDEPKPEVKSKKVKNNK